MFQTPSSLTYDHVRPALDAGLAAIARGEAAFDLTAVNAVDSSAVVTVLAWQRASKARGIALTLHNIPASLHSLMSLYGVDGLLGLQTARADLPHH